MVKGWDGGLGEVLGSNPNGEKNKSKKILTYKKKIILIFCMHACLLLICHLLLFLRAWSDLFLFYGDKFSCKRMYSCPTLWLRLSNSMALFGTRRVLGKGKKMLRKMIFSCLVLWLKI